MTAPGSLTGGERAVALGVVVAFALLCLAVVLLLPPQEGYDEAVHYSYISLLSDRGEIPDVRTSPLDATLDREHQGLPWPEAVVDGLRYRAFFEAVDATARGEAVARLWRRPDVPAAYAPAWERGMIWEGQHPPLYYALMVAPYRMARSWPPGWRVLWLRTWSVALACASLAFWLGTIRLLDAPASRRLLLLAGVAVLFLPSLFFDVSRIGNDALAALLFAGTLHYLVATTVHAQRRLGDFAALGLVLALGLLTKMYFVAVGAGAVAYTLWRAWRRTRLGPAALALRLALLVGIPGALTTWWFVLSHARYGMILASVERLTFREIGSPPGDAYTWGEFFAALGRGLVLFGESFLWSGTWSLVSPPPWAYAALAPLLALLAGALVWRGFRRPLEAYGPVVGAAVFLTVPVLLGLATHMYWQVRYTGAAWTSGHYVFFAWPVMGMVFAPVLDGPVYRLWQAATWLAFLLAWGFELAAVWLTVLVYAGVVTGAEILGGEAQILPPTLANIQWVFGRLWELAFPYAAALAYAVAALVRGALVSLVLFANPLRVAYPGGRGPTW